jgi:hypothetical protein
MKQREADELVVQVTERELLFLQARCRPFVYRARGKKKWQLGWAMPGLDVRAFLRQRLEPSLGPLEVQVRPLDRPAGVSPGAWQLELEWRREETHPVVGHA